MAAAFEGGAQFDLALIDMTMPGLDGLELLALIRRASPATECIIVTAVDQARIAVDCLRQGAYDYLVKPVPREVLQLVLRRALERKRLLDLLEVGHGPAAPELARPEPFARIVTRSAKMMRVLREAELHAASNVPILITGESGTGKELLARAIHQASPRADQVFTPINMASLTSTLFEAEFFGHARGAFTDAHSERQGLLQHTDRGTLFLDEIGALSAELQAKLLRVLQDGEYSRLGSSRRRKVDLRVIAATNEDLGRMMSQGRFRKDLYYRIRGGRLHLPPLRERTDDVSLLIRHFLGADAPGRPRLTSDALERLLAYDFPGNVRELESVIRAAANLAQARPIATEHLPEELRHTTLAGPPATADHPGGLESLAAVEKAHILLTYELLGRNKSAAARALGIGLNTLRRRLADYGVG
jgi:DNA-binding NtrC family response regulator